MTKTTKIIFYSILTIIGSFLWFSWVDAAGANVRQNDSCAYLADISDRAYWECRGASCLSRCSSINPDLPEYCDWVCANA